MESIRELADQTAPERLETLRERVGKLLEGGAPALDEDRLLQELALTSPELFGQSVLSGIRGQHARTTDRKSVV